ncbi:O-methyltransferase [Bacteroidia bacterium]|nr:O-methyltransferase [Bacteroidia bacterium]
MVYVYDGFSISLVLLIVFYNFVTMIDWFKRLRQRRGFGVHSPFMFHLITEVIGERRLYYRYYDIELIRQQLLLKEDTIVLPSNSGTGTIAKVVEREGIRPKRGALLFRLTNYFQPDRILQIGPTTGLSTLYLSSYKPELTCVSLETIPEYTPISRWVYEKGARTAIDLQAGDCQTTLPPALERLGKVDFVYFNTWSETSPLWLFDTCLKYAHNETVFVFEGIRVNKQMRVFWETVCEHPEISTSIDLYSTGIVLFNKNLHKQNYRI